MAASPTDIRKGKVMIHQNQPHLVLEVLHRTQGRQAGFMQVTLRNLVSGSSTTTKIRTTDTVEFCHSASHTLEFTYVDVDGYHFMDPESFEDMIIAKDLVEDQKGFLVENASYDILFVNDKPVQLQLPAAIEMKVVNAPEAIRGDTAGNVQKSVTTESGLVVQVPLFIKEGEVIRVSTSDKAYLGRA